MASDQQPDRRPLNERYPINLPKRAKANKEAPEQHDLPLRIVVNDRLSTLNIRCDATVESRQCEYERGIAFGDAVSVKEEELGRLLIDAVYHAVRMHPITE